MLFILLFIIKKEDIFVGLIKISPNKSKGCRLKYELYKLLSLSHKAKDSCKRASAS